ncbi:MAG: TonB-dependent receptor [Bacteroidales bacterium]|nr:TonB-dependent receptor [Bacteroidales bacterium]
MKKTRLLLALLLMLVSSMAWAQNITVKGKVTDAQTGDAVPSAAVVLSGTANGVVSDFDGNFSITAPSDGVLLFSSIGYETVQIPIQGKHIINVELSQSAEFIDETIVVAYGTAKKSSYSGSASMVRADELAQKPVSSVEQALQGKVPGLQVSTASGQPGAATTFRIRGTGSLNASSEPLYVIDGVATTNSSYSKNADDAHTTTSILSSINPQDIESITVLKDAAAASLYGSRAANGVVIITTKSGKAGQGHVNFNAAVGISSVPRQYEMASSTDYYKLVYNSYLEAAAAEGKDYKWANEQTQGTFSWNPFNVDYPFDASGNLVSGAKNIINTDWQSEVLKKGYSQDYNVSYSGGTDKINYFFSAGYFDQTGTTPTARYTRYSGKANIEAQVKPWLKGGMNVVFSYATQNSEVSQSAGASPLNNALSFPNAVPVYKVDSNGDYVLDANNEKQFNWTNPAAKDFNPVAIPYMNTNQANTARLLASAFAEVKFMEGLTAKTVFSPDYVSVYDILYWNKYHGDGPAYNGRGGRTQTSDLMFTSTTTLNFNRTFADKHNVSAMAGYEYWQSKITRFDAASTGFAFDFLSELAGATKPQSVTSWYTEAALISWIGHAEYNFAEKYFASASFRRDGSSVFGADNKWGNFFSVGASWRAKQEDYLKDVDWLSDLKLRVSYGTSGNNAGLSRYQSLGLWTASDDYQYGYNSGLGHTSLANPALGWEKQKMLNIGVDFGVLKNKITGSIEFFNKTSDALLYEFPLPASVGITSVMMNLAKVQNQGVEFAINAIPVQTKDFVWDIDFNFSYNADKILDLAGDDDIIMGDIKKIWKVGKSQYEFYMPTWAGVDPENGDPLWKTTDPDTNKESTTNVYSLADQEMQGRATPWGFGSLSNNLSWKGFDLSVMFYYNLGGKFYDSLYANMMHEGNNSGKNINVDELNAWTPSNTSTDVPKYYNMNDNQSNSPSTRFLYDATYLKLKNVNLSYTLPRKLVQKSGVISNVRFYINADNLFTVFADKRYKGYDDIDIFGIGGYDAYAQYIPLSRTYTMGVNITF